MHDSQRLLPLSRVLASVAAVATALLLFSQRLPPLCCCLRSGCHRSVVVFAAVATALLLSSQRLPPLC
jgi:hypothetical protein